MQITTTTIKHKRYTTAGWNLIDPSTGTYKNTLSQGEIGVLLGDDLNTIIEVRIGIRDKCPFGEGFLVNNNSSGDSGGDTGGGNGGSGGNSSNSNIIFLENDEDKINNHTPGKKDTLYVHKSRNCIFRWDDNENIFKIVSSSPGQGNGWWSIINGGNAFINENNLGSSSPL